MIGKFSSHWAFFIPKGRLVHLLISFFFDKCMSIKKGVPSYKTRILQKN